MGSVEWRVVTLVTWRPGQRLAVSWGPSGSVTASVLTLYRCSVPLCTSLPASQVSLSGYEFSLSGECHQIWSDTLHKFNIIQNFNTHFNSMSNFQYSIFPKKDICIGVRWVPPDLIWYITSLSIFPIFHYTFQQYVGFPIFYLYSELIIF